MRLLVVGLLMLVPSIGLAAERVEVCAKYRTDYGWSKGYRVEATKTTGSELNRSTGSWKYNGLASYIVIFWDKNEVSIIEMDWPSLSAIGTGGEDQRGVKWEISTSSLCY